MKLISEFWKEEDAVGVVEVILILVVLIGLVLIFKKQLVSLVNSLMEKRHKPEQHRINGKMSNTELQRKI